jgi:hypothetical protein
MMHIAEATSNAIRMNATWALIPPAMSLVRDRYEQTVRFSWLARNPDPDEWLKYERALFGKINSIVRRLDSNTIHRHANPYRPLPQWATEPLDKKQRAYLDAWNAMDLRSMAKKRDVLPAITDTPLANEGLACWSDAVYAQFSSVSHYDRFSIEMVKTESNNDGTFALTVPYHWIPRLILYTGILDMIQCFEITYVCFQKQTTIKFESLFLEWRSLARNLETGS